MCKLSHYFKDFDSTTLQTKFEFEVAMSCDSCDKITEMLAKEKGERFFLLKNPNP